MTIEIVDFAMKNGDFSCKNSHHPGEAPPHPLPPWHPPPHHPHGATCAADAARRHAARRRRSGRGLGDEELNVNMVNMWIMLVNILLILMVNINGYYMVNDLE